MYHYDDPNPQGIVIIILAISSLVFVVTSSVLIKLNDPLIIDTMYTTELTVTGLEFTIVDSSSGWIIVHVTNSETIDFTVKTIKVNGENVTAWSAETSNTLTPNDSETFTINHEVTTEIKYHVALFDTEGILLAAYTDKT